MAFSKAIPLKGAVVAVTGGGRGIGAAIAETLVSKGARVAIGDVDLQRAQNEANRLDAFAHYLDVRSRDSFADFIKATEDALGPVDILVNNAGIMPMGAFVDESDAISNAQIDINFRGVLNGMKTVLPGMASRGRGHIVNVASLAGRFAIPGAAVYSGTKFAVVGMTESVAGEYRDKAINFTVILPSKVLTDLSSGTDEAGERIPAVTPHQVAAEVAKAIRKPRHLMVTVPSYLRSGPALFNIIPERWQERGRRLIGDDGILTCLDRAARRDYEQRLEAVAQQPASATANKKPATKRRATTAKKPSTATKKRSNKSGKTAASGSKTTRRTTAKGSKAS